MKLSCVCVLFVSVFIAKISSEKPTELEKVTNDLMHTVVNIIGGPISEFFVEAPLKDDAIQKIFRDAMDGVKETRVKLEKEYLSLLSPEMKETQKKAIAYISVTLTKSYTASIKTALEVTNKSFDALPNNVQKDVLDTGREIDGFLKLLKGKLEQALAEEDNKKP